MLSVTHSLHLNLVSLFDHSGQPCMLDLQNLNLFFQICDQLCSHVKVILQLFIVDDTSLLFELQVGSQQVLTVNLETCLLMLVSGEISCQVLVLDGVDTVLFLDVL